MVSDKALNGKSVFPIVLVVKLIGIFLREFKVSLEVLVYACYKIPPKFGR